MDDPSRDSGRSINTPPPTGLDLPGSWALAISHTNHDHKRKNIDCICCSGNTSVWCFQGKGLKTTFWLVGKDWNTTTTGWNTDRLRALVKFDFVGLVMLSDTFSSSWRRTFPNVVQFRTLTCQCNTVPHALTVVSCTRHDVLWC